LLERFSNSPGEIRFGAPMKLVPALADVPRQRRRLVPLDSGRLLWLAPIYLQPHPTEPVFMKAAA
jgi:hypothetical protein